MPGRQADRELAKLARDYARQVDTEALLKFAEGLGLTVDSLQRLSVGWDGEAWTFPMRDSGGEVVGIRRRLPNRRKLSVKGGHGGLFIPIDLPDSRGLLICEGETDTAALLGLEFAAIGRPSCRGGVRHVTQLARGRAVTIVADRDLPGTQGAARLGGVLRLHCPSVRIITPPEPLKDARAWVQAGLTRKDVLEAIRAASVIAVQVCLVNRCKDA